MSPTPSTTQVGNRPPLWLGILAVALLGALASWALTQLGWPAWLQSGVVAVLCASVFAWGQRVARGQGLASDEDALSSAPLVEEVLPVWQRHIDSARRHSEDAMSEILASFSTISQRLEDAVRHTQSGSAPMRSQSVDELMHSHESSVQAMLGPMREMQRTRDEVLDQLGEMGQAMADLRQAAVQIKQLARRTTMVALNASVEATRAGEQGSGFAVVAAEVQQLATQQSDAAQLMMSRATAMEDRLSVMRVHASVTDRSDNALMGQAEAAARVVVADLIGDLNQLGRNSRELQDAGKAVQDEVERVLMNFQSQDRLSQMLDCVTADMELMGQWIAGGEDLGRTQVEQWLERLDASYTMEEQRAEHHGNAAIQRETAIEFF